MAATVPEAPRRPSRTEILVADPVRAATWRPAAEAANCLLGRGGTLIPYTAINQTIPTQTTYTLRFTVRPRYQATHRSWHIGIVGAGTAATVTFTDPSGTAHVIRVPPSQSLMHSFTETISSRTSAITQIAPTLGVGTITGTLKVTVIACFENPRPDLAVDVNDDGVDLDSFDVEDPIYNDTGKSLGGLATAVPICLTQARRNSLFQFVRFGGVPVSWNGALTSLVAFECPILERLIRSAVDTSGATVSVYAYTRADAATNGDLVLSMQNGATLTIAILGVDTGTWRSGTITVHAEDLSTSDGRRSTTWDRLYVEGRRTSGAGNLYLESLVLLGRDTV